MRIDDDMTIRDAVAGDLPAIVGIYNGTVASRQATADTQEVTVESRQAWFDAHRPDFRPIWIAENDGEVAGWLSLTSWVAGRPAYDSTAEVSIYIAAANRRRGHGRRLLSYAIARCPDLGVTSLIALVFGHNDSSIALFTRHGFAEWGRMPQIAVMDGIERDLVVLGLRVAAS